MDDLLKQFLAEGEKLMVNAPLDFFANYSAPDTHAQNGIHIVWFIAWCHGKKLLSESFREAVDKYLKSDARNTTSFRDFCARHTEGSLRPEHLSEQGAQFARKYYGTGCGRTTISKILKLSFLTSSLLISLPTSRKTLRRPVLFCPNGWLSSVATKPDRLALLTPDGSGCQRCGSSSATRRTLCIGKRCSTSFRYVCGSSPLSAAHRLRL